MTLAEVIAALSSGGYGIAALTILALVVRDRQLQQARDKSEAILREILPLVTELPRAVETLHQLARQP